MCDSISGWIHVKTHELFIWDGASHSATQKGFGWTTDQLRDLREFEWPWKQALVVRTHNDGYAGERLRNVITARFSNRDALVVFAKAEAAKHGNYIVSDQNEADALPAKINNLVIDGDAAVSLPVVSVKEKVYATLSVQVTAEKLSSGAVYAGSAKSVSLPKHTTGYVYARSAKSVSLPKHTTGYVYASSAKSVSLPKHTTGDVYASSATEGTIGKKKVAIA